MLTAKQKAAFRQTKAWLTFRSQFLEDNDFQCDLCGKKYRYGLNVHHVHKTEYENLDPSRFKPLCKCCHKFVHAKYNAPYLKEALSDYIKF